MFVMRMYAYHWHVLNMFYLCFSFLITQTHTPAHNSPGSLHPHRRLSAPNFTPKLASCIGNNATGKGRPSSATTASPLIHSNSAPMAVGRRRHTVSMSLPLYCQDDVESDGIFYGELNQAHIPHQHPHTLLAHKHQ